MYKKPCIFSAFALLLFLISCTPSGRTPSAADAGDTLPTQFAQGFDLVEHEGYTEAIVYNPWAGGRPLARYLLVRDTATAVPAGGTKVKVPIGALAVNSATYLESLRLLGALPTVTGVCSARYIYNPQILRGVGEGRIADLGDSYNLNIEKLLTLRPEALITPAYNTQDENTRRLERCGIPLVYTVEWQEASPLGRAEWIRFIAAFYDKLPQADTLFAGIARRYAALRDLVPPAGRKKGRAPSLLVGQDFRGSWSMPAENSFNAVLYRDAGADYVPPSSTADAAGAAPSEGTASTGSRTTTVEAALLQYGDADCWVGVQASTYEELQAASSRYALFRPFRSGEVYNFNGRTTPEGGNDYWESAVVHADSLLADLIRVFHPTLLPGHEWVYVRPLR